MSDHEPVKAPSELPLDDPASRTAQCVDDQVGREFSEFYRAYLTQLVGFLGVTGAKFATAADLAQETMIDAYQAWARIDHPKAWVRRVASRKLARHMYGLEQTDPLPENCTLVAAPDALAEWETRQELLVLLQVLPPRQRQVLAWSMTGYTPAQIAEELNLSGDTVRANLMKARAAIARHRTIGGQDA